MNPDLAALLSALRDDPADAVANLALADWCLEQHDDATQARGEHVRLSLALAALAPNAPARRESYHRLRAMEKRHRAAWLGSMRPLGHRCDFLPGGLVKLMLSAGKATQARTAGVAAPSPEAFAWVSQIETNGGNLTLADFRWLAGLLPAGFVRECAAGCEASPPREAVVALVRSAWSRGLRSLTLTVPRLGDDAAILAQAEALGGLRKLKLRACELTPAGLASLAASPHLAGLTSFALSVNASLAGHWSALAGASWDVGLSSLSLDAIELRAAGLREVLGGTLRPRSLWLTHCELDASAARELATWPGLAGVRSLTLDYNRLDDGGAGQLARSPFLGELRHLSLANCWLGPADVVALAAATMPSLEALNLGSNDGTTDAALLALCRAEGFPKLRTLDHSNYRARPETRKELQRRFRG